MWWHPHLINITVFYAPKNIKGNFEWQNSFLMWSPLVRRLILNHLLWSLFRSSLYINILHFWRTFCEQLSMYWKMHLSSGSWPGCIYCNLNLDQKNPLSCRNLNSWPPWYQSDMLPTELSWLDFDKIVNTFNFQAHRCLCFCDFVSHDPAPNLCWRSNWSSHATNSKLQAVLVEASTLCDQLWFQIWLLWQ